MTEQKIKVYKTQMGGRKARIHRLALDAYCYFDDAIFEMPVGGIFTLEIVEMAKDEFDALDGFEDTKWENK